MPKRIGAVAFWLAIWELASLMVGNRLLLAGPLDTLATLAQLVVTAKFWVAVGTSAAHIICGFCLSFCIAVAAAAVAKRLVLVRTLLALFMAICKSTPVVCIIVLLLIWVGSRHVSTIAVTLVVLPAIYFSTLGGLDNLDPKMDELLRVYHVGFWRRLGAFVWPSILPFLAPTCELVAGMAWKAGVAAELIGTPLGTVGERIYQAKLLLESGALFSWTLVVIALAFVCEKAFLALLRRSGAAAQTRAARFRVSTAAEPGLGGFELMGAVVAFEDGSSVGPLTHTFEAGSRTCLSSPSGSGKTTTLHLLAGLLTPSSGAVTRPERIALMTQESRLIEELSAMQNIAVVTGGSCGEAQARSLLAELLDLELLDRPVSQLSGGQRRRVELARALAFSSSAIILDEPFASLDDETHGAAIDVIKRHLGGRTLVLATHDIEDAFRLEAQVCTESL